MAVVSFSGPVLESAVESRSSPQLEPDPPEISAGNSTACGVRSHLDDSDVLRKAMIQKRLHFSKWRLAQSVPGHRLTVKR